MKHAFAAAISLAFLVAFSAAHGEEGVSFVPQTDSLQIKIAGRPFATYVFRDDKIPRPYLGHVRAPDGTQVTRNHPPVEGQDATDHDTFHPGIWLAFGDLSGADFWRNKATVKHLEFVEKPAADSGGGRFAVKNRYLSGDKTICDELCRIAIRVRPSGYLVVWDSQFSGPDDFYFGDQEELGLGVRVATPLAVKNGGRMTNSNGLVNEKQIWGKQADWCDYSGTIDGRPLGILLVPDPRNFRSSWFHARDYGFLAANPFGRKAFTGGAKSKVTVGKGESLRLRYAVLIHSGPIDLQAANRDALSVLEAAR
ncbi:MAG: PmoA family protein [Pirellulales bacterium]